MAAVNVSSLPLDYVQANQGPKVDVISITAFTLATVAVVFRFLTRILKASLWWDDWAVLAALIFAIGPLFLTIFMVENGLGKHAEVAGVPAVRMFYKCIYPFEIIYAFPIAATKFSILLHYKRIFCVQSIRIPIYIVGSLVACWLVMKVGTAIFTCTPIPKLWDPTIVGGSCINLRKYFIGVAVPNIFTDIALLAMPLPYIYHLNMKTLQKVAVMFVFILGGFVTIVSIIRLTVLLGLRTDDVIWFYVPTIIWTNIEIHIGIVTASVPAIWPLLRAFVTNSIRIVAQRSKSLSPPSSGAIYAATEPKTPSFLSRSQRSGNSKNKNTTTDDMDGFVQLENIRPASPAPSSRQGAVVKITNSDERGLAYAGCIGKPEDMASSRIQVRPDWTVSTESHIGMEQNERSFVKWDE